MFEDIISKQILLALNVILTAVIIGIISTTLMMAHTYHEKQLESQIVSTVVKEERNNLFYNNTVVYQQDIVSLILKYKGDRKIMVYANASVYEWSSTIQATTYQVSVISTVIPKDKLFDATLILGPNGYEVVGYKFVAQ